MPLPNCIQQPLLADSWEDRSSGEGGGGSCGEGVGKKGGNFSSEGGI